MILFDVTLVAHAGEERRLVDLLSRTMAACLAEPGCLIYRFSADLAEAGRFHLVELWEDEAALHAHAVAAPFRAFLASLAALGRVERSVARCGNLEPYTFVRPSA